MISTASAAMRPRELLQFLRERRSLRQFSDRAVPRASVETLLEAATWAPSAHNRQPWRFVVIEAVATKQRLAQAMGARLRQDLQNDGLPKDFIEADVARSYSRITSAPLLILLCMSLSDMDVYLDQERNAHEATMAQQSTAMAGQNLLLMAASLGLGACWMCAPLFCQDLVVSALELPADWRPQGMITLGYPAQQRQRERDSWKAKTLWR